MDYHEAVNYCFDLRRFPQRPGTEPTASLLAHLDDPQTAFPCVQIAGSNGKGSTARMLASMLQSAGLDVGLYTSPHLDSLRERVRVNGRPIPKSAVESFVATTREYITDRAAEGESPTFFETVTALALQEFRRQDVDVAILEVGIGGKYDATSAVDPVASAVTSVTLEHTDLLGEDRPTIARDKAAIAPADGPLITAADGDALAAIREDVENVKTVSSDPESDLSVTYQGRDGLEGLVEFDLGELAAGTLEGVDGPSEQPTLEARLALLGAHQAENAGVAVALVAQLVEQDVLESMSAAVIKRGLRRADWPGRFEVVSKSPLVVLDGSHNPDACRRLRETLAAFDFADLHVVVGAMADKDHRGMARALGEVDRVTACEPVQDRAETDETLATAFDRETDAAVTTRSDVAGALNDALETANADDCVLVTGSLYTVAEARTRWIRTTIPKRVESIESAESVLENAHVTDAGTWRMRGKAVHRVLRTRVQPRQAQYCKEELLSLGGECAISGFNLPDQERVDVVMMGTMAQFLRLCSKLDGQPYGLAPLSDHLREHLGIGVEAPDSEYPWSEGTAIMGILNVTPDSFHDGGDYEAHDDAVARARELAAAGADIIDVGGESTRPGADPVPVEEERDRVIPVVERLEDIDALVSVDTRKPAVARAALEAGADILNDVSGLSDPELRALAVEYDVPVVVMHSIETPVDPETAIEYDDVTEDVIADLQERVLAAEAAGLDRSQIIVDPGLGFGKNASENFAIVDRIQEFQALGCPTLVGHSHKSMFEAVDKPAGERYEATVATTALAADRGADIVRVHDVEGNATAVDVVDALREHGLDR